MVGCFDSPGRPQSLLVLQHILDRRLLLVDRVEADFDVNKVLQFFALLQGFFNAVCDTFLN